MEAKRKVIETADIVERLETLEARGVATTSSWISASNMERIEVLKNMSHH